MNLQSRIQQFKQIREGLTNYFIPDEQVEELAKERSAICLHCPSRKDNVCSECGCKLELKTRSVKHHSKCPLDKW